MDYAVRVRNIQKRNRIFAYFCIMERWLPGDNERNICPLCRASFLFREEGNLISGARQEDKDKAVAVRLAYKMGLCRRHGEEDI